MNIYSFYAIREDVAARTEEAVTKILYIKHLCLCLWVPGELDN